MRQRVGAVVVGIIAVVAAACTPGAPAPAGSRAGVGQVTLTYSLADPGGGTVSGSGLVDAGSTSVTYTSASTVAAHRGTVGVAGTTLQINLDATGMVYNGFVRLTRPSVVDRVLNATFATVAFDGDGDSSATITDQGWTLTWSLTTSPASGLEPTYDALTATEGTYCQDAQQRLAGLSNAEVPLASIGNTSYAARSQFAASKATLAPLAVQTWSEPGMVTTADGNVVSLTKQISCKSRNGDHVATTGVSTLPEDNQCIVLTQRSLDLAWAELTPTQQTAFAASGVSIAPGSDIIRSTGAEWTTPIPDSTIIGSAVTINAHALQTRWNDPAFAIFPDTIRGVHYCTTWAPAYAYWWYTVGAFSL
jgi:hypothetical protein